MGASQAAKSIGTGALFLGEFQYHAKKPPFVTGPAPLPSTCKLGLWVGTERFPDQRFDTAKLSLAAPASTGAARLHRGNFSLYGIVDQRIWRPNPKTVRSVGIFLRAMARPEIAT
jgi:porin